MISTPCTIFDPSYFILHPSYFILPFAGLAQSIVKSYSMVLMKPFSYVCRFNSVTS